MAFRLGDHVRSGFIENREKGKITGELRIPGLAEPVTLDLKGHPHPDLAGCCLSFENPAARPLDRDTAETLRRQQQGLAGDISASQKRKVPPTDEAGNPILPIDPSKFVLANILDLEWYDFHNGRVVVEGVGYEWSIDLSRFRLTDSDIAEQAEQSESAATVFMNLALEHFEEFNDEIRTEERENDPDDEGEAAWERRFQLSEERTDALMRLLDEAKSDEERQALMDNALQPRTSEFDEDSEEAFDEADWDDEDIELHEVKVDPETVEAAKRLGKLADEWLAAIPDRIGEPDDPANECLVLGVKIKATVSMMIDPVPFDPPEEPLQLNPGFTIARLKREIALSQSLLETFETNSQSLGSWKKIELIKKRAWEIRDQLVEIVGRVRRLR